MKEQEMKKAPPEVSSSSYRRRKRIAISTSLRDPHTLEIKQYPDYRILPIVLALLLGYAGLVFYLVEIPLIYFPVPFIVLVVHFLFNNRPAHCIVDKQEGQIVYFREGVLGSHLGEQKICCNVSEIKQLEMKVYRNRYGETFRTFLVLNSGQRLPLSSTNLNEDTCRRFANRLARFLEREIPAQEID